MAYVKLVLKFGPYIAIALLVAAVLWYRGDLAKSEGDKKALGIELQTTIEANKEAKKTVDAIRAQRVDNDAIADEIAKKLAANRALFDRTTVLLKEARNDPKVRSWADTPVPGSVRAALAAPGEVREPPR
jgi:hypothetical protein